MQYMWEHTNSWNSRVEGGIKFTWLISDGCSHHPWCSQPDTDLWWLVSPPPDSCMYDSVQASKSISPPILISPHTSTGEYLPATRTKKIEWMWLTDISYLQPNRHIMWLFSLFYKKWRHWSFVKTLKMTYIYFFLTNTHNNCSLWEVREFGGFINLEWLLQLENINMGGILWAHFTVFRLELFKLDK